MARAPELVNDQVTCLAYRPSLSPPNVTPLVTQCLAMNYKAVTVFLITFSG